MLARLFSNISVQSLIRAILFSLILAALSALHWSAFNTTWQLPHLLWTFHPALLYTILLIGLPLSAWFFNAATNALGFLKNDYQFIAIFSLLWLSFFLLAPSFRQIILMPLGIWLIIRLLSLVQKVDPSQVLFDTGVICGIMTLIAPSSLFFLLVIWIATLNYGHMRFRTFLMPVVGMLALWFMIFSVLYFFSSTSFTEIIKLRFDELINEMGIIHFTQWHVLLPASVSVIFALFETTQVYGKASVLKRQTYTFLTLFLILSILLAIITRTGYLILSWTAIPLGCFLVNLVHYSRKRWQKEMVYVLLLASFLLVLLL